MRVNCHAHVFNLDDTLSNASVDIIKHRIVEAVVGTDLGDSKLTRKLGAVVGDRIVDLLKGHPEVNEETFVRGLLRDIEKSTGLLTDLERAGRDLPEPFGEELVGDLQKHALLGLKSIVTRMTGFLRKQKKIGRTTWTDRLDLLAIAFEQDMGSVADRLLSEIDPEDAAVALIIDVASEGETDDQRRQDLELYKKLRDDTVSAVLRYPGRLFPFIGVDPQRVGSATDPALPGFVELTEEALDRWGFVGVKLYPAVGYSPADAALDPVYKYCQEHSVPVMTHASGSGFFRSETTRKFSNPSFFGPVLEKFPELKVCLAHLGGSGGVASTHLDPASRTDSFQDTILTLMDKHENVYTDISFNAEPFKGGEAEAAYFDVIHELLEHPVYRARVLFGTDFWLVRMKATETEYWRFFEDSLTQAEFTRIAETNPRRYLGLPRADGLGASEPMSHHIDFLIDNIDLIEGRPASWLVTAVEARDATASKRLQALRKSALPATSLAIKSWVQQLAQIAQKPLSSGGGRLTRQGSWSLGSASFRLGGLGLTLEPTATGGLDVDLFNGGASAKAPEVLTGILGVTDAGPAPTLARQAWLRYRLEGGLAVTGKADVDPDTFGLRFEAGKSVVLSDYRAHSRSEEDVQAAVASDLHWPRFAFQRHDVLRLPEDDALELRVTGKLGAAVELSWASVLAGNLNELGDTLGVQGPLDVELGLSARFQAGLAVHDDFRIVFARPRANPAERPFRVSVRKARSRSTKARIDVNAGAKFADPEVVRAALEAALGERLAPVDRMLAKSAGQLTSAEESMRSRLVSRLGLESKALATIRAKRNQLEAKAQKALDAIARAEVRAGVSFEYGRFKEEEALLDVNLTPAALRELHSDLARGNFSVLLERSAHEPDEIELVEFLRESTLERLKSWGFSLGLGSRFGSVSSFDRERRTMQVDAQNRLKATFLGCHGYEVERRKKGVWSGWTWSGELEARMDGFQAEASLRSFRFGLELQFEWTKQVGPKLMDDVADAAVLWQVVEDPATVVAAMESLKGKEATARLVLRVAPEALPAILRVGAPLDTDLAALALAAAMPFKRAKKDPVRDSVAERRRLYSGLWKRYLKDASRGLVVNAREYGQLAERHFTDLSGGNGEIRTVGKMEARRESVKFLWTFPGAVEAHPKLFAELSSLHRGLELLWDDLRPGANPVPTAKPLEPVGKIYKALKVYWSECLQTRAFGRYLLEAASGVAGGASLVSSSLTLEDRRAGTVRVLGAERAPEALHETVDEA